MRVGYKLKIAVVATIIVAIYLSFILYLYWPLHEEPLLNVIDTGRLKEVKVAILYTNLNDRIPENRSLEDAISIVMETNADFIWYAFAHAALPIPESAESAYSQYVRAGFDKDTASKLALGAAQRGFHYKSLREQIEKLKERMPNVIYCAAIHMQFLYPKVWNEITLEVIPSENVSQMVLVFSKWGLPYDRDETQEMMQKLSGYNFYYPDVTNEDYRRLVLSWIEKMISCGVDAIWLDMPFAQARVAYQLTKNFNHPAVKEAYMAVCDLIDEIHEIGREYGRYIYVGTWPGFIVFPYDKVPDVDFVTCRPTGSEVAEMNFDDKFWSRVLDRIHEKVPDAIIFWTPDWGPWNDTMLAVFSQVLSPEQQREFLETFDSYARERGMIPVYPVHGGDMGPDAVRLSYGKYKKYDALAPEFQTFDKIKDLCRRAKSKVPEGERILDVIDLRGQGVPIRLLITSLQGIVNRGEPRLYIIWESIRSNPTISEFWLYYYTEKGWIDGFKPITIDEALEKYRFFVKGMVVYDPEKLYTINIAVTLAGIYDLVIVHPGIVDYLKEKGFEVKYDLRGKFHDGIEAFQWQLENLLNLCNKSSIFLYPTDTEYIVGCRCCLIDLAISYRMACINFKVSHETDRELFHEYLSRMNEFGLVIGYPYPATLEVPTVSFVSSHNMMCLLASFYAPNFSVHCKIGDPKKSFDIAYTRTISLENGSIFIALGMSDLALNSMQSLYYELWNNPLRGHIPLNWWLDPLVMYFCPGIVEYYYETLAPGDIFFGAFSYGRIAPSKFSKLEEYLLQGDKMIKQLDLKVVAFSDCVFDQSIFQWFAKNLSYAIGFFYGYAPNDTYPNYWIVNGKPFVAIYRSLTCLHGADLYTKLSTLVEHVKDRPLFVPVYVLIADFIELQEIATAINALKQEYDGIVLCNLYEMAMLVMEYMQSQGG